MRTQDLSLLHTVSLIQSDNSMPRITGIFFSGFQQYKAYPRVCMYDESTVTSLGEMLISRLTAEYFKQRFLKEDTVLIQWQLQSSSSTFKYRSFLNGI